MARKKVQDPGASSEEAYLIAFGSTMTILLALFIVLSTLSQSQEAGFRKGTGSFVRALDTFGLAGLFSGTPQATDFEAVSPHYQVGAGEGEKGGAEAEQEVSGDVHDFEQEQLTRMLQQLRRQFESSDQTVETIGVAVVPLPGPARSEPPHLSDEQIQRIVELLPVLTSAERRVYVEVGVKQPGAQQLERGARIAAAIKEEIARLAHRDRGELPQVITLARVRADAPYDLAVRLLFVR